jgi:hypothetical protein
MTLEELDKIANKVEEHISILVDYDVISAQTGDTLAENLWSIITSHAEDIDSKQQLAVVRDIGDLDEVDSMGSLGLVRDWIVPKEDPGQSR